jgi:hypothetical protein
MKSQKDYIWHEPEGSLWMRIYHHRTLLNYELVTNVDNSIRYPVRDKIIELKDVVIDEINKT